MQARQYTGIDGALTRVRPEEAGHGYVTNQLSVLIKNHSLLSIVGIGKKAQLQDQFSLGIYGQISWNFNQRWFTPYCDICPWISAGFEFLTSFWGL